MWSVKKKEASQPRVMWTYQETEDLIEIMRTKFITKILSNKNCRKMPLFEEMKAEMDKHGHSKTTQQIIFKYKNLCAMYRSIKQKHRIRPSIKDKRFEFYDKMHELFSEVDNGDDNDADYSRDNFSRDFMMDEDDNVSGNESRESSRNNMLKDDDTNHSSTKRRLSINDEDPLKEQTPSSPSAKRSRTNKNDLTENEMDDEFGFQLHDSYNDREKRSYIKLVNHLVRSFKTSQLELQEHYFQQQKKLQLQQQEWEERIMDIEREFFIKILQT